MQLENEIHRRGGRRLNSQVERARRPSARRMRCLLEYLTSRTSTATSATGSTASAARGRYMCTAEQGEPAGPRDITASLASTACARDRTQRSTASSPAATSGHAAARQGTPRRTAPIMVNASEQGVPTDDVGTEAQLPSESRKGARGRARGDALRGAARGPVVGRGLCRTMKKGWSAFGWTTTGTVRAKKDSTRRLRAPASS